MKGAPQPRGGSGDVVELRTRPGYKPDLGALARQQVESARRRLGLTHTEFAEVLGSVLGWDPTAEMIESWEASVVPPGDVVMAAGLAAHSAPHGAGDRESDLVAQLLGGRFADLDAIYATRSEFVSRVPPHALFDGASDIRAAGLSLNILCQQYATDRLRDLIEAGTTVRCLVLDPAGEAIKHREREEGYNHGHLSSLTELNVQVLTQRVRRRLSDAAQERLSIATYDETIRFNIIIVDETMAVVQPYLHAARGLEAPTFVLRRQQGAAGLFPTFEQTFAWLWERSTPL